MSPSELPPGRFEVSAGWYDDPRGAQQYRYWDGVSWTDHIAPAVASRRAGRSQGSRAWIAVLLLLLAFLVALVLIEDSGGGELNEAAASSALIAT